MPGYSKAKADKGLSPWLVVFYWQADALDFLEGCLAFREASDAVGGTRTHAKLRASLHNPPPLGPSRSLRWPALKSLTCALYQRKTLPMWYQVSPSRQLKTLLSAVQTPAEFEPVQTEPVSAAPPNLYIETPEVQT